uniref:Endonuclease/exonuclease/phosphatase domain-containing protein n=1 Tax=Nicotiana tabacum TaxID=4097 RepID=A0A1S4A6C7_TOBAC|nr:PREDICTED: uncharacterized protein LOC107794213 [Nicotiana tabacum]
MWDPTAISFTMLETHEHFIHGIIQARDNSTVIHFSAIYGLHTVPTRTDLWRKLKEIDELMIHPWLIMGDFNSVLDVEDRVQGSEIQEYETRDFRRFIEECGITELQTSGRLFTWTNNHVYSRIDRALVNAQWMSTMPPSLVHINDPYFSDHSPLCIEVEQESISRKKPFRFLNCLANHAEFEEIVKSSWSIHTQAKGTMTIWFKLKKVKGALKKLNSREFIGMENKIKSIRDRLKELQTQMRDINHTTTQFEEEKELKQHLEKWSLIEESIYRQKSRIQWLKLGDSNSAYFYASMKGRRAQNYIKQLTSTTWRLLLKPEEIQE